MKQQNAKMRKGENMDELKEVKERIDLLEYIKSQCDLGKGTKTNGGYLFKNCPMCRKHKQ